MAQIKSEKSPDIRGTYFFHIYAWAKAYALMYSMSRVHVRAQML